MEVGSIADWAQAMLTVAAGGIAWLAFRSEREAVRLTQRADILVSQVGVQPRLNPSILTPNTIVSVTFKNFGPTRASGVRFSIALDNEELSPAPSHHDTNLPVITLAAGEDTSVNHAQLGRFFTPETIQKMSKGEVKLAVDARVSYRDVFGKRHQSHSRAVYYGPISGFIFEQSDLFD